MISEYINYLSNVRGYSQNTLVAYRKDLEHFVNWIKWRKPEARWSTISREDIDAYVTEQAEAGLAPATTNRRLASISGLYRFFRRQGKEVVNPCQFESRRKQGKTLPNTIPTQDIKTAYEHSFGATRVMLGILATTGIRIQELLEIRYEDIDFDEESIRIHGKGSKQRKVYTTSDKLQTLRTSYEMGHQSGQVFTIDQRTARYMIWQALKPYSTATQLSPHAIRHTVATNMASHGANVTAIASVLGHDDIKTTQKYIDMTQNNKREIYTQYNLFN